MSAQPHQTSRVPSLAGERGNPLISQHIHDGCQGRVFTGCRTNVAHSVCTCGLTPKNESTRGKINPIKTNTPAPTQRAEQRPQVATETAANMSVQRRRTKGTQAVGGHVVYARRISEWRAPRGGATPVVIYAVQQRFYGIERLLLRVRKYVQTDGRAWVCV